MFDLVLFAAMRETQLWHAIPMVASISLVYSATRHEHMTAILMHAGRTALWVVGFMAAIFAVLWLLVQQV